MKSRIVSILAVSLVTATVAFAAEPQEQRQSVMKEMGGAIGSLVKMAKGEVEYDAAAAKEAFAKIHEDASKVGDYFPEGSETGHDTHASPKIWENKEDFNEHLSRLQEASNEAAQNVSDDADEFRKHLGKVGKECGSCHETYRTKMD